MDTAVAHLVLMVMAVVHVNTVLLAMVVRLLAHLLPESHVVALPVAIAHCAPPARAAYVLHSFAATYASNVNRDGQVRSVGWSVQAGTAIHAMAVARVTRRVRAIVTTTQGWTVLSSALADSPFAADMVCMALVSLGNVSLVGNLSTGTL